MNAELKKFLTRNDACIEVLARLAATGAAAADAADAARADAEADADAAAADAAARDAQTKWLRENFALSDLNIN